MALLSTGDELVEAASRCRPGRSTTATVVAQGLLQRLGCDVLDAGILPDDLARTRERLAGLAGWT
ncbi:hypothetical protein BH77_21410 [Pseudomonas aeruginosa C2773C]|nr:hypothetical protein BH77_21410 [Pseudomonas aeruginosa C2773C]